MNNTLQTRVVTAPTPGGPEMLRLETRMLEPPAPGEVLIQVKAAGINRPDVLERMGLYPAPPGASPGLGLEVSGHVLALGAGASGFGKGDPVVALLAGGGYADIARAKVGSVMPAPEGVALEAAAGLPETVLTVWANVFERCQLKPGERFLVHGGSSGIGTTAIQMAKAHGARVATTAGTDAKCALCRELGADLAVNYKTEDWASAVRDWGGADVILDMVAGDYTPKNLAILNLEGRLAIIAFLRGAKAEIDLMSLMLKRQTLTGSTLRARSDAQKASLAAAVVKTVWPWVAAGQVRPVIDSVFSLDDVAKAHARMDSMAHAGKILLRP